MGVKRSECHLSIPFQISATGFAIEQESEFQPENDALKFPLISFCYRLPFIALSKSSLEPEVSTMSWVTINLLHGPDTKCIWGICLF